MSLIRLIVLIIIAVYFLGCGKSDYEYSPYCANPKDVSNSCSHLCDGQWARKINEMVFYFETEGDCLQ